MGWCRAVFLPLPKKGNLKECSNHRTISLIVHASKVLLRIIINRIKVKYQQEIAQEQAGFVDGKGTREQIVNIRMIMEKCKELEHPLYLCFIDYAKAFDCVGHTQLWHVMKEMGFPLHIIQLISKLYEDQESSVRTSCGDTEWFKIGRGVRQGCVMSPCLYNIYAEAIMRKSLENDMGGIMLGGERINNLRFADDTTLMNAAKNELMATLKKTKTESQEKGLLLNTTKTKIMVVDKNWDENDAFVLDGCTIEVVKDFVYLGSQINTSCTSTQDIRRRLAMARAAVQKLVTIWKSHGIRTSLKLRVLRSTVFPIASYGCESWAPTKQDRKRIDSFEIWCYRRMLRVSWMDRRTNAWVLEKCSAKLVLRQSMVERKLRFFGHIVRSDGLEKRIILGKLEGARKRGRPSTSWLDDIRKGFGGVALAVREAENRQSWKGQTRATAARLCAI